MRASFGLGLVAGILLAAPLVSILYLLHATAGMPFIPFDLFDGMVRILPGAMVTFGIDTMVRLLMFLGLDLSASSKTAEQIQAIAIFLGISAFTAGIFFAVLKDRRSRAIVALGVGLGVATALPIVAVDRSASSVAWTIVMLVAWGVAVSGVRQRIAGLRPSEASSKKPVFQVSQSLKPLDRRRFLIDLGGATASITVIGAAVAAVLRTSTSESVVHATSEVKLPDRRGAVEPAPGTRPEYTPVGDHYRIDINLLPMKIDGDTWRLPIIGMVERPRNLTLQDFRNFGEPQHLFVTMACISNPLGGNLIGTTRWSGVSVQRVLRDAGFHTQARFLKLTAEDGFYETVPLDLVNSDERVMFTYLWDGKPLTAEHGFPMRIYIPDRYGMKQPKWIVKAELIGEDEPGYWVIRGWDKTAQMKATSVIDTIAVDSIVQKDGQMFLPIGGMAHAGARGISRVEVQVDEGAWVRATLRTPLSDLTWVLWRYDWPFQSGKHVFRVRCYDGAGVEQIEAPHEPHPSGASGIFSLRRNL
jgi:DMSO/TMAO reductase YedYZ molybdopterin-dependent catalytic subunit